MNRGGISIIGTLWLAVSAQLVFTQEPPRDLRPDEIKRIMEQERIRRAQELQTDPGIGISIQMAQEIHSAITAINIKAEELRLVIRVELQRAQKAESLALAAGHYETCLMHSFAFRRFGEGQLAGKLEDVNHPKRVAALTQLDDLLVQVYSGYVKNRVSLAEAHQLSREYDKAKRIIDFALQILPDNLDLQAFARANERAEAEWIRKAPGGDIVVREKELKVRDQQIRVLLRDGKYLYELRDFDEAEDKFKRVLDFDPVNDVANNYLRLINKIRGDNAIIKRDRNFRAMVQEVNDAWDPPSHQKRLPVPNPEWQRRTMKGPAGNAVGGVGGNNNIFQKLASIRIPRMEALDGFTLIEAVNLVALAAKENDTTTELESEKGVNMIISTRLPAKQVNVSVFGGNNFGPAFAPRVNPKNGLPEINRIANGANPEGSRSMSSDFGTGSGRGRNVGQSGVAGVGKAAAVPAADPRHFDPNRVTVRGLTAPLTNLTLGQLIHAITEACDEPINFEVKNGLLVFKYRRDDLDYQTRTYTIKPNMFWQNLASGPDTDHELLSNLSTFNKKTGDSNKTRWAEQGSASGGGGGGGVINNTALGQQIQQYFQGLGITAPQVFINPANGQLLVRAPLADLDLIDQAIQILNSSPEQLYIEAKFAEIEFNDGESLGFDWYLGNSTLGGDKIVHGAGPHPTFIGKPTPNNPSGFFPYPGTLMGNTFQPSQYSIMPSPNEGRLTSGFKGYGNPLWSFTGIMTDPQFRMVINAISQQEGAELLSAPRILAISGQRADIQLQDQRNIVTGVQPTFTPGAGGGGFGGLGGAGGGTVAPQTTQMSFGPTLSVVPYVNSDGYTIEMSVSPSIIEFLGYEESTFEASVFAAGGNVVRTAVPMPRIRRRALFVNCVVWDQTVLAVGGLLAETVQTTRDKVPYFGDLPFVGRLFRGRGRNSKKKNMVIYVKPTIIDPAGNKKNNPAQMPFARTQAPDSIGFVPPQDPAAIGGGVGGPINKIQGGRILAEPRR
jgi:general secretion pathway protein D